MNIKSWKNIIVWRFLSIKQKIFHLEGQDNCFLKPNNYFYFCRLGNKIFYPKYFTYSVYDFITMYGNLEKGRIVVFDIFLENDNYQILRFFISYKGNEIEIFPSLGWFIPLPNILDGYYISFGYIVKYINLRFNIYINTDALKKLFEEQYCIQLKKMKKYRILKLRNDYFQYEKIHKDNSTKIWIIIDKLELAGDNGEYFFRFLHIKKPRFIRFYFAIKKNCIDYERLKTFGNILELGSEDYLNLFLKAEKIISSSSEEWVYNPFGNERKYIIDLFHFDFIFIKNGIIKDDLSKTINRLTKNFSLLITSSKKEYKHIIDYKYHYDKNNVIITGLPRYDHLYKFQSFINKEKIVTIIPTWRMYIKGTFNLNTHESIYSNTFNLTNYFNFYNNLINDEQLLENMKKWNFRGIFCLHPYFSKQWKDFKQNEIFSVLKICDYQNVILKSSLLITDYSSIFFDFAFLKRPIIYSQFDYEEYRINHYQKGYFNYIRDGFGPVCFDYNCTINKIKINLEKNCQLESKFSKRINTFFEYIDGNNNERLYFHLIKKYEKKNKKDNKLIIFLYLFLLLIILTKNNFKRK